MWHLLRNIAGVPVVLGLAGAGLGMQAESSATPNHPAILPALREQSTGSRAGALETSQVPLSRQEE